MICLLRFICDVRGVASNFGKQGEDVCSTDVTVTEIMAAALTTTADLLHCRERHRCNHKPWKALLKKKKPVYVYICVKSKPIRTELFILNSLWCHAGLDCCTLVHSAGLSCQL